MSAASAARILAPGVMTWSPTDRVAQPAKPLSAVRTLHSDGFRTTDPLRLREPGIFRSTLQKKCKAPRIRHGSARLSS